MGGDILCNIYVTFEEVHILVLFREGLKGRRNGVAWSTPSYYQDCYTSLATNANQVAWKSMTWYQE